MSNFNIQGLIDAAELALKLYGCVLSKENFTTHDWIVVNKVGNINILYCSECLLLCGIVQNETLEILSTYNYSCHDVKLLNILK